MLYETVELAAELTCLRARTLVCKCEMRLSISGMPHATLDSRYLRC